MITPAQENERILARILGIGEDQAAARLAQTFRVTAREGEPTHFARELVAQLERTITHASDLDRCDLEIAVHAEPKGSARQHLYVQIDGDAVSIARQPHPKPVPPADLHGVQRMIAACYTASVALAALIDGIEDASDADPLWFVSPLLARHAMCWRADPARRHRPRGCRSRREWLPSCGAAPGYLRRPDDRGPESRRWRQSQPLPVFHRPRRRRAQGHDLGDGARPDFPKLTLTPLSGPSTNSSRARAA